MVKGNGPIKRAVEKNDIFSMYSFLTRWHKLYLSLDEDGLFIFESKSSTTVLSVIVPRDIESIRTEQGTSTRSIGSAKAFAEDQLNVVITTKLKEEVFIRYVRVLTSLSTTDFPI